MKSMQKLGAIGGLTAAATFVVGIVMFATMLTEYTNATDPRQAVSFLIDNQVSLYVWNIIIMIVFGIVLVPFVLALRDRLQSGALERVATVFGLIWSGAVMATGMIANISYGTVVDLASTDPEAATTVWITLDAVQKGLGGGNEVLGGVWVLLVGIAGLRTGILPRWLNHLGIVMGIAGLATVIPPFKAVGAIFGLGLIVWFVGVAVSMRREPVSVSA